MHPVLTTSLIVVAVLAISAAAGGGVVALILRWASSVRARADAQHTKDPDADPGSDRDSPTADSQPADPADVLRGGLWIGVLERLAATTAVLTGYPAAIAVIVAIKGLGRFPELRQTDGVSERFIIGTLASLLWATAWALAGRAAVTWLGGYP